MQTLRRRRVPYAIVYVLSFFARFTIYKLPGKKVPRAICIRIVPICMY